MSDTEPTKLTDKLQQIITSHTMELKAGHDHLMFEQILALIQSSLEDCLPEKKQYDYDFNYQAVGFNKAINQTKANLKKLMGEL